MHEHPLYRPREPREHQRLLGRRSRTASDPRCARASIRSDYNIWIEHRDEGIEVAAAHGGEEGVNNFSLPIEVGIRHRSTFRASA